MKRKTQPENRIERWWYCKNKTKTYTYIFCYYIYVIPITDVLLTWDKYIFWYFKIIVFYKVGMAKDVMQNAVLTVKTKTV
jgi:hypothetical protein